MNNCVLRLESDTGVSTGEIIRKSKLSVCYPEINGENFPFRGIKKEDSVVELFLYGGAATDKIIFDEFSRRGLRKPQYEHALLLALQHPEVICETTIIIPHEPWKLISNGYPCFFALSKRCKKISFISKRISFVFEKRPRISLIGAGGGFYYPPNIFLGVR